MKNPDTRLVGDIVAEDYRTVQVFKDLNIDFFCKGNCTLTAIAEHYEIDLQELILALRQVKNQYPIKGFGFKSWPLDLLMDYIRNKHLRYIEERIPILKNYLKKLCDLHGEIHPELFEILDLFGSTAEELVLHMKKEDLLLFDLILALERKNTHGERADQSELDALKHAIEIMRAEHRTHIASFDRMAGLAHNYDLPLDGHPSLRVTYSLLQEFEEDFQEHVHLEHNILFPRALKKFAITPVTGTEPTVSP